MISVFGTLLNQTKDDILELYDPPPPPDMTHDGILAAIGELVTDTNPKYER